MTGPARRGLLAAVGGAALASPALSRPANATDAAGTYAALTAACDRYATLSAWMNSRANPEHDLNFDQMRDFPALSAAEAIILAAIPTTHAGMAAVARVALMEGNDVPEAWSANGASRFAHRLALAFAP